MPPCAGVMRPDPAGTPFFRPFMLAHPLEAEYLQQNLARDWNRELACHVKVEGDPSLHVEAFMILDNG